VTLRYYFDQHVSRHVAHGVLRRGIDVLSTQEEGAERAPDEQVFAQAVALGRVMVTEDSDYVAIANRWLAEGRHFPGLVKVTGQRNIGRLIEDLHLVATCYSEEEVADQIVYIPV
jgi:hypothetical protein